MASLSGPERVPGPPPGTVADIVADALARAGVRRAFAEGTAAAVAGLERALARRGLEVVLAADAGAAAVMAAVTGQLTDAPGVALLAAPDAAEEAAGHAALGGAPLLVVTPGNAGPAAAAPFKGVVAVEAPSAAHWMAHAIQLTLAHPRGPVRVDLPAEVRARAAVPVATAVRPVLPPPDPGALDRAARLLDGAARPVVVAGRRCCAGGAADWLRPFAEARPAPVLLTRGARGVLPDPHPLALGVLGGGPVPETLLGRADAVILVGADAAELAAAAPPGAAPWPAALPVLHLGPPPVPDVVRPTVDVAGDIALVLEELAPRLRSARRADWDVAELDRLKRLGAPRPSPSGFTARRAAGIARAPAPPGTLAAVDAGPHLDEVLAGWPALAASELLYPLAAGLLDFALPAAVAARLARPDRDIVVFTGGRPDADASRPDAGRRRRASDAATLLAALAAAGPAAPPPVVVVVFVAAGAARASPPAGRAADGAWGVLHAADEREFAAALARAREAGRPVVIEARVAAPAPSSAGAPSTRNEA